MEFVRLLLVFLHLLGMGMLVAMIMLQAKAGKDAPVNKGWLHGAALQLLTGVALVVPGVGPAARVDAGGSVRAVPSPPPPPVQPTAAASTSPAATRAASRGNRMGQVSLGCLPRTRWRPRGVPEASYCDVHHAGLG